MKFAPYSYSRIAVYQQCPKKFKYSYIDKLPKKPQDMTALLKGGALHNILEVYPEKSNYKLAPKYQHIADEFISSSIGSLLMSLPSKREQNIALTKDFEPCGYNSKEAMFRGSIDYFTYYNDYIWIVDYKSGKKKDIKYQSFDQNEWYAVYLFQKYEKLNTIKITYQYIEHLDTDHSRVLTRENLETYKNNLITNISNIENDTSYCIKTGPLCDWCDYQEHCENDRPKHEIGFDY